MTTAEELRTYVGAPASDDAFVAACLEQATSLVTQYVSFATVPADIVSRATLECGSELFHRRSAPNGIAQFATPDSAPIRVARDPMVGAYPILRPWVAGGFA